MITKFEKYNESIKSLLVGPSKEEVWKSLGYDSSFGTPEEFLLWVIDGMKIKEKTKDTDYIIWEKNGKIIFAQDFDHMQLYVDDESIWCVLEKVFGLDYDEIKSIITDVVEEHLNWNGFTPHFHLW